MMATSCGWVTAVVKSLLAALSSGARRWAAGGQAVLHLNALLPLIAEDSFSALASAFPCLVGADFARRIPPELLQALLDTGCRMLPEEMTHVSSEQTKPVLPPAVHWLTGDWYGSSCD